MRASVPAVKARGQYHHLDACAYNTLSLQRLPHAQANEACQLTQAAARNGRLLHRQMVRRTQAGAVLEIVAAVLEQFPFNNVVRVHGLFLAMLCAFCIFFSVRTQGNANRRTHDALATIARKDQILERLS